MSLYKRKDSSYWWVKVSVTGCKPIQQSTGTADKQKAKEYEAHLIESLWQQKRLGVKPRYIWQEAVVRYIEEMSHKASHETDLIHFRRLQEYLDDRYLDEITRSVVDSFINVRLRDGVSNATVNRCTQLITRVLRKAAIEWDWLEKAPKFRILPEPRIRVRWLSKEEASRLIAELPEHLVPMVRFSLATGLRKANVVGLEWSQVDLAQRKAWIHADQAKARKAIGVPLSGEAVEVLRGELFKHPSHVFTYQGKPVRQVNGKAWQAALKRAGIENFRWHDLRHTWASWHVQNGTPLYVLQQLGGWHSMDMVQKYAHLSSDHLAEYVERVSGLAFGEGSSDVATIQLRSG